MNARRKAQRQAAYDAWCEEHTSKHAEAAVVTAVVMGTMPYPSFGWRVATRLVQRMAADLASATRPRENGSST